MKRTRSRRIRVGALIAVLGLTGTLVAGCAKDDAADTTVAAETAAADTTAAAETAAPETTVAADTAAADTMAAGETMAAGDTMAAHEHDHGTTDTAAAGDAAAPAPIAALANGAASKIVASTSWVAAVAKLAGATNVSILAPNNIVHPPDYDPKPSDLAAIADAELVLLAGFEGFAKRMGEAAGTKVPMSNVTLSYDPAKLGPEVLRIAAALGTTDVATANVAAYTKAWTDAMTAVTAKTAAKPQVLVSHMFVAEWAMLAGWTPAAVFGPAPLTAGDVADLSAKKPTIVFENHHMPGGREIADAAGAKFVSLVNFPADDLDLTKVIQANADAITAAVG